VRTLLRTCGAGPRGRGEGTVRRIVRKARAVSRDVSFAATTAGNLPPAKSPVIPRVAVPPMELLSRLFSPLASH
jgi:hypothetical protein